MLIILNKVTIAHSNIIIKSIKNLLRINFIFFLLFFLKLSKISPIIVQQSQLVIWIFFRAKKGLHHIILHSYSFITSYIC